MFPVLRQKFTFIFCIFAAFTLVACGRTEVTEREAFINFLQKEVLSRKNAFAPFPSQAQKESFGRYASHYQIIVDFTNDMEAEMIFYSKYSGETKFKTIEGIRDNWREIEELHIFLQSRLISALETHQNKAHNALFYLDQPEDLQDVYILAFDKTVNKPVEAVNKLLPVLDSALDSSVALGRLLDDNRERITISDTMILSGDPILDETVNIFLHEINKNNDELTEAAHSFMRYAYYGR